MSCRPKSSGEKRITASKCWPTSSAVYTVPRPGPLDICFCTAPASRKDRAAPVTRDLVSGAAGALST
eukprot:CAMPEP_0204297614 /NCGR_PEP_ID=MMETSP0468-20130131/73566_1 /ASSEMBLY_ACC=CAM_ASM_000383 /TAXON_ID=2969 /ORGANISM="Oxyrrhis marina" /LENGTH=66 /DNA_ID=CAMNT_0051276425 /DNA_START=962 /DNA_END=1158 /DNA_ORIENTATION=+